MKKDVKTALKRRREAQEQFRQDMPQKYRGMYDKATNGRSRSMAIRTFCLYCMGWSPNEVEKCTALGCPMYKWRFGNETRGKN